MFGKLVGIDLIMRLLVIERKDRARWITEDGEIREEPTGASPDASERPSNGDANPAVEEDGNQSKEEDDPKAKSRRQLAALKEMALSPRTFTICLLSAVIGFMSGEIPNLTRKGDSNERTDI
jgi:hypothetical protein